MGLDMFFYVVHRTDNWSMHDDRGVRMNELLNFYGIKQNALSCEAKFLLFMWRKAHIIHDWFVQNVQEGTDDCGEYFVSREQITELIDFCNSILNGNAKFDQQTISDNYNDFSDHEYVKHHLEKTVKELTKVLDNFPENDESYSEGWSYMYSSSW